MTISVTHSPTLGLTVTPAQQTAASGGGRWERVVSAAPNRPSA